jgi:hypothetical protein
MSQMTLGATSATEKKSGHWHHLPGTLRNKWLSLGFDFLVSKILFSLWVIKDNTFYGGSLCLGFTKSVIEWSA